MKKLSIAVSILRQIKIKRYEIMSDNYTDVRQ